MSDYNATYDEVKQVSLRPLSKGMVLNEPSNTLEVGAFLDLKNVQATLEGLRKRLPYQRVAADPYYNGTGNDPGLLVGVTQYLNSSGDTYLVLVCTTAIYTFQRRYGYSHQSVFETPTTGVQFTGWCQIGDELILNNSNGEMVVFDGTFDTEDPLAPLLKDFWPTEIYDGKDPDDYVEPTNIVSIANGFQRLWVLGTTEGTDGICRTRLRWTDVLQYHLFPVENYYDIEGPQQDAVRILSLSSLLIAYFRDSVFVGRPSNIEGLPFTFTQLETGGIGLIGTQAVCSWLEGHFWIGQDDFYFLSVSSGLQRIGSPIARRVLEGTLFRRRAAAHPDPQNNRICFIVPRDSERANEIWSFDYKSQAWSYGTFVTEVIGSSLFYESLTYDMLDNEEDEGGLPRPVGLGYPTYESWFNSGVYPTYSSMMSDPSETLLVLGNDYVAFAAGDDGYGLDDGVSPIPVVIQSGYMDFDYPDLDKTITRLNVRMREAVTVATPFTLEVTVDGGITWKMVRGGLTIRAGQAEGWATFRATGSTFGFRLTQAGTRDQWILEEIGLMVVIRGIETERRHR